MLSAKHERLPLRVAVAIGVALVPFPGGGDGGLDIHVLGLPAETFASFGIIGIERWRITGASDIFFGRLSSFCPPFVLLLSPS